MELFPSLWEVLDYLHLKDFLKYECELYLKQPLIPPQCKMIVATIDLPLKLDDERVSLSLEILEYAAFAPIMQLKMRHISCWNVPNTTPLEMSFHHYLET